MTEYADRCTRVYMLTGRKAHLLAPGISAKDNTAAALCGITCWPAYFRGAGEYGEREQAAVMPLCRNCEMLRNSYDPAYQSPEGVA